MRQTKPSVRVRPADPEKLERRVAIGKAHPLEPSSCASTDDNPVFACLDPDERDVMVWRRANLGLRRIAGIMRRSLNVVWRIMQTASGKLRFLLDLRERFRADPKLLTAFLRGRSDVRRTCPHVVAALSCDLCSRGKPCPMDD